MELDVREVAAILHVPEYTVYKLITEDSLPASQISGQYRFSRAELLEWASERSVNPMGILATSGVMPRTNLRWPRRSTLVAWF